MLKRCEECNKVKRAAHLCVCQNCHATVCETCYSKNGGLCENCSGEMMYIQ